MGDGVTLVLGAAGTNAVVAARGDAATAGATAVCATAVGAASGARWNGSIQACSGVADWE